HASERAFGLGDFVFVVRKLQVRAAPMDVQGQAQQRVAHGRTLDVPAGASQPVGRLPFGVFGLVGLGRLPEHDVQRVALGRGHRHALAGAQVVERLARELAVAFEAGHGIVDVAVVGTIGQAFFFQAADDVEHLPDILGGARFAVGRLHTQGALVSMHGGDIVFGNLADAAPGFHGPPDDLVVDVGDVAH